MRTVVLPILPGGPFYVYKLVLVFVGKLPLIPIKRIVPSSPGLVVQGSTELRRHGVLRSSAIVKACKGRKFSDNIGSGPGCSGDRGRLSSREGVPDVAQEPLFLRSCLSRDFSARSALSCSALVRFCCSLSSLADAFRCCAWPSAFLPSSPVTAPAASTCPCPLSLLLYAASGACAFYLRKVHP